MIAINASVNTRVYRIEYETDDNVVQLVSCTFLRDVSRERLKEYIDNEPTDREKFLLLRQAHMLALEHACEDAAVNIDRYMELEYRI